MEVGGASGTHQQARKRCGIVLGSSSFPDPDWPDLSNEISPGQCIPPMPLVWSWPGLCGCINWQRHTPAHQDGSHFEPHLPVDMRLTTPSLLSVLACRHFPCYILSALGIFAIPSPAPHYASRHRNKAVMSRRVLAHGFPFLLLRRLGDLHVTHQPALTSPISQLTPPSHP